MPEETSGAFWDATIYSPRGKMKLSLPLKEGLDPSKYGGYSSEKYAYFFCYYAKDKKGKRIIDFAPVPVSRVAGGHIDIEEFGREVAEERGYAFESIARAKIAVKQLIEVDGCRLFITGASEVRAGTQIFFSQEATDVASRLCANLPVEDNELNGLFCGLVDGLRRCSARLYGSLKLEDRAANFEKCTAEEKGLVVKELLALSSAKNRVADLRAIGGSKFSGAMSISLPKVLSGAWGCIYRSICDWHV